VSAPAGRVDYQDRSPEGIAAIFRQFGREEAPQLDSPLYEEFCEGVASHPELIAIAARVPQWQPPPNMLFAAVQYLLLRGAEHPLASHYPALRGDVAPPDGDAAPSGSAFRAFRDFCLRHQSEIEQLVSTRRTQTNVLRRCCCLLPAFVTASRAHEGRPLALVEIGTSAGLLLQFDRYHYCYDGDRVWGDDASPVRLRSEVRGEHPLPELGEDLRVSWRRGIDINPVDIDDDDAVAWLRALIWPEHVDRHAQLLSAIGVARDQPATIVAGDAAIVLEDLLAEAPRDAALCVFASHALYQFPADARKAVYGALQRQALSRDVDFISMEATGATHSELFLFRYRGDGREKIKLANCSPHGWWIEWLDP